MSPTQHLPPILPLQTIHARWTLALSLPPSAQISNLRRLVRVVTQDHHPALRPLSLADLCQLYLDLALAYAFLGEYYLASKVFQEAVENHATSAVGWFGLGLAQAELADWRDARRSWKRCLRCFGPRGCQQESVRYPLFQGQVLEVGLESGEWTLERKRVEFNFHIALREKGSKKAGVPRRAAGQKRPELNGLPAGLRFGPGWDATVQFLHSPLLATYPSSHVEEPGDEVGFISDPQPAVRTPPSSSTSSPATLRPRISSHKPLPEPPRSPPTHIPSLTVEGSFNHHTPSLDKDAFTISPEKDILDPFATSSHTLIAPPHEEHHDRFSRQSTLYTPGDQYLSDHHDYDDNDVSFDASTAIDDTIASWSGFDQTREEHTDSDPTHGGEDTTTEISEGESYEEELYEEESYEEESHEEEGSHEEEETSQQTTSDLDDDGEILQPRVFEGFGASSQQQQEG